MFRSKRKDEPATLKRPSAVVTGVGPVSALGCGRVDFFSGLIEGRSGLGPITLCDTSRSPSKVAAEVEDFDLGRYLENGKKLARITPRSTQLALAACVLALHDAELDIDACDGDRLGAHVGTGVGNIATNLSNFERWSKGGNMPAHAAFLAIHHSAACVISTFFNIRGPILTTSTGCNSGIDSLGQALRGIQSGALDVVLVVGTDTEVVPEIMAALNASGSLSTKYNDEPAKASRPFESGRDGNVIGEGAGALVIESEDHARRRGARIYAQVSSYAQCAAGQGRQYSHNAPQIDVRPSVRALRAAVTGAGWSNDDVNVLNANGSSSVIYDKVEALAFAEAFGERLPEINVHSIKSMLGQHGAGTSALQAICACMSIRQGLVPPTVNYDEPDPECGPINVSAEAKQVFPTKTLVHSIGLGGFYYSAAAFESHPDSMTQPGDNMVRWSKGHSGKYAAAQEFQEPLTPWKMGDSWIADTAEHVDDHA